MSTGRIIISVIILLVVFVRLGMRCSKMNNQRKINEFVAARDIIEAKRMNIFNLVPGEDSLHQMIMNNEIFNNTLDSCIGYYRKNYNEGNADTYGRYLKAFYEYKRLFYLYDGLFAMQKDSLLIKKDPVKYEIRVDSFLRAERSLLSRLRSREFDVYNDHSSGSLIQ